MELGKNMILKTKMLQQCYTFMDSPDNQSSTAMIKIVFFSIVCTFTNWTILPENMQLKKKPVERENEELEFRDKSLSITLLRPLDQSTVFLHG